MRAGQFTTNQLADHVRVAQTAQLTSPASFVDLFAGAGGLTAGLMAAGLRPLMAVESNATAAETYRSNFGDHVESRRIQDVRQFPKADVVVGGPPCQGFSLLGLRDAFDERNGLWAEYWRAVKEVDPEIFVLENVPGFAKSVQFERLKTAASRRGYQVKAQVMNAADFGTPQTRKRVIVIGRKQDQPLFQKPTHSKDGNLREQWLTVRDAIGDVPLEPDCDAAEKRRPLTTRELHFGRTLTPTSLLRFAQIPEGGNRFDLQRKRPDITPPCWLKRDSRGSTDVFGRLWWHRPSVTIRTEFHKPEKGRYLHPSANRPITHYEAARLQGFDDLFVWYGSKLEIARQIGNAVPIPLAQAIGASILAMLGQPVPLRYRDAWRSAEPDCSWAKAEAYRGAPLSA